jgi:hypothetical protein
MACLLFSFNDTLLLVREVVPPFVDRGCCMVSAMDPPGSLVSVYTENTQSTKTYTVLVISKKVMEISTRELEILKKLFFGTDFENSGTR